MTEEWDDLVPVAKAPAIKEPVRVAMSQGGRLGGCRLSLILRKDVLGRLAGRSWRYRVSLGKGENRHLVRLVQDDTGPFEAVELGIAKGGGVFRILLPPNERFPACKISATGAKWEIVGKGLAITLPSWAWDANQKKAAERQAAIPTPAAGAGLNPVDAIGKLLDDDIRARLAEMAQAANKSPNKLAAELLTSVIEDDTEAEST